MTDALRLDPDSLLSKFGFNDGDVPDDYEEWQAGQGIAPVDWIREGDWHAILAELVRTHLLPRLDHAVTVTEMAGNHNPVRAIEIDGEPAPDRMEWEPEYVDVPFADVQRVADDTENGLFPLATAVAGTVRDLGLTPRQAVELRAIATTMEIPACEIRHCAAILANRSAVDPDVDEPNPYSVARARAARRAAELVARPDLVPRTFDEAHWTAIHHQLFQDTNQPAAFAPQKPVAAALTELRALTPESATGTLAAVIPVLVDARPFTGSLQFHDGNRRSRRILVQHALERVGLSIDWKWFRDNRERYETADGLKELLDLAVRRG
ncbi:MAG TPA: hypothetical protein VHC49_20770 [Mycobacteriales bacterium]|nr:hypothetical protein [Mycobacteriales bacterium]